jgi:hypothetical protein
VRGMMNVDGPNVPHAPRQKRISDGAEDHDGEKNQVFTKRQRLIPKVRFLR